MNEAEKSMFQLVDLVGDAKKMKLELESALDKPGAIMVPMWVRDLVRALAESNLRHAKAIAALAGVENAE